MGIPLKLVSAPLGALMLSSMIAIAPAAAQSSQRSAAATPVQSTILGPAMLRPGTADLSCGAGPAGLGPWGADRIEHTLSLTDPQQAKFNALKTASQRAIDYLNESCPRNDPVTPTGRLRAMERRLAAMLEAVRTVEPALDDFYGALTDEQKARMNSFEPSKTRASPSKTRVSTLDADKAPASAAEPGNESAEEPDRPGRVHHRHHHGHGRFLFRLPIRLRF
jgi:LTXXQ motif family protein